MTFKINIYNPITGIREPLIIVMPQNKTGEVQPQETETTQKKIDSLVSLLDIMPTILDWHNVTIPNHLTGKSLLPQLGTYSMIPKLHTILPICKLNNLCDLMYYKIRIFDTSVGSR